MSISPLGSTRDLCSASPPPLTASPVARFKEITRPSESSQRYSPFKRRAETPGISSLLQELRSVTGKIEKVADLIICTEEARHNVFDRNQDSRMTPSGGHAVISGKRYKLNIDGVFTLERVDAGEMILVRKKGPYCCGCQSRAQSPSLFHGFWGTSPYGL